MRRSKAPRTTASESAHTPIVSSAHLAANSLAELSEFEFGLTMANNAFHRWIVRCMDATGVTNLGPLDILVLHSVNHRERRKRLADLCLVLNVEDSHIVSYCLKKLTRAGLVSGERHGKEIFYGTTKAGRETCERYRAVRQQCLIGAVAQIGAPRREIGQLAAFMRALSGLYDQAARAAASL